MRDEHHLRRLIRPAPGAHHEVGHIPAHGDQPHLKADLHLRARPLIIRQNVQRVQHQPELFLRLLPRRTKVQTKLREILRQRELFDISLQARELLERDRLVHRVAVSPLKDRERRIRQKPRAGALGALDILRTPCKGAQNAVALRQDPDQLVTFADILLFEYQSVGLEFHCLFLLLPRPRPLAERFYTPDNPARSRSRRTSSMRLFHPSHNQNLSFNIEYYTLNTVHFCVKYVDGLFWVVVTGHRLPVLFVGTTIGRPKPFLHPSSQILP